VDRGRGVLLSSSDFRECTCALGIEQGGFALGGRVGEAGIAVYDIAISVVDQYRQCNSSPAVTP